MNTRNHTIHILGFFFLAYSASLALAFGAWTVIGAHVLAGVLLDTFFRDQLVAEKKGT